MKINKAMIFGIRGLNAEDFAVQYVTEENVIPMWFVYRMPGKEFVQRYQSLAKAFARVGSELEKQINNAVGS